MIEIRRAEDSDFDGIWEIFHEVVQSGDTYVYDPRTTREQAYAIWMSKDVATYVALLDGRIVGTYILKPNHAGLGSHVANAGYMVKRDASGKGIGAALCEHSLEEARRRGFLAMQFNMVVSTNERAVALWQRMGFAIVGTLPKAFRHSRLGLVDAYVMHRLL
jgi:L-amino acid N-acyltransferase YncA